MKLLEPFKSIEVGFNAHNVSAAWIYGARTRLNNCYEPDCEQLYQPEFVLPPQICKFSLTHGESIFSPVGKLRKLKSWLLPVRASVDSGEIIYDARGFFNNNIAHLMQYHLTSLVIAINFFNLSASDIVVVVRADDSVLVEQFFLQLRFSVRRANCSVRGLIFHSSIDDSNFFQFMPMVKNWLDSNFKFEAHSARNIYIGRKKSRRISNERELIKALDCRGFETFYMEELPLEAQFAIFSNASCIVSVHGAALGMLPFSKVNDLSLLELFPCGFVVNPFRKTHSLLFPGGLWRGVRSKLDSKVVESLDRVGDIKKYANDDFIVDVKSVELALNDLRC